MIRKVVPKQLQSPVAHLLSWCLILQLCCCGTLLHPERVGQRGGRIDPGVAVLDGLGLLLFIIPGLVAFAVDFSNGAIYLPGTHGSVDDGDGELRRIAVKSAEGVLTEREIELALEQQLGHSIDLSGPEVEVIRLQTLPFLQKTKSGG